MLFTTTINVLRPSNTDDATDPYGEGYGAIAQEAAENETVAEGVKAHISSPSGRETARGGEQEVVEFGFACEVIEDLRNTDLIQDNADGAIYLVTWSRIRRGLGLNHITGGLRQVRGLANA